MVPYVGTSQIICDEVTELASYSTTIVTVEYIFNISQPTCGSSLTEF